jgi:hypothetical protein
LCRSEVEKEKERKGGWWQYIKFEFSIEFPLKGFSPFLFNAKKEEMGDEKSIDV